MRIVMMGTPEFAVPVLEMLIRSGREIAGVFTQPDRPSGRGKKITSSPVKILAEKNNIPVFQPERIRKTGIDLLKALKPDLCVTAAFGQILSQEILDIPPLGNINVHASLLPKHRGAAPIAYAIMNGDSITGVTTMMMDQGIDTGDILLQASTPIGECETCAELTDRLSLMGAELLSRTLNNLESGTLQRTPQNESEMSYDPMLSRENSKLDFQLPAPVLKGKINGLNPWPCTTVTIHEEKLKLLRAVTVEADGIPGEVISSSPQEGFIIACGEGAVRILEVQAPGGKKMKAVDYLRGHRIEIGTKLSGE